MSQIHHLIMIMHTPMGQAPLWVRKAWVGLYLPAFSIIGFPADDERGACDGTNTEHKRYGFSVPQDEAIRILLADWSNCRHLAGKWWMRHGFPKLAGSYSLGNRPFECFHFAESEAEVVNGTFIRQRIIEVKDEDRGNPYR
ncbi:hypothetical protein IT397_01270 [Candidatus Nomurabacteria bacterium]|nr:hypothetical protein [Candidatus Nomurabacteria bacterium]